MKTSTLVPIKTLFCIVANKTDIEGFWKNKEGKVYKDYIVLKRFFAIEEEAFKVAKQLLFSIGEEAVFYKDKNNNAIIENKEGSKTILKQRIAWKETKKPSKAYIEALLQNNEGFTIYKEEEGFKIELYK
jgi:hypothetical protein